MQQEQMSMKEMNAMTMQKMDMYYKTAMVFDITILLGIGVVIVLLSRLVKKATRG